MSATYAEAREACVGRWGPETFAIEPGHDGPDAWPAETDWCFPSTGRTRAQVAVSVEGDRVWLSAFLTWGVECAEWTLAGEPTDAAPLTPLPDALDAAERWLAERNDSMKGP